MLLAREVHCIQVANLRGVSRRARDVDKKSTNNNGISRKIMWQDKYRHIIEFKVKR
jgi:hypothetical protein